MSDVPMVSARRVELFVRCAAYGMVIGPILSVVFGLGLSFDLFRVYPVRIGVAAALALLLVVGNLYVARWSVRRLVRQPVGLPRMIVVAWLSSTVALVSVLLTIPEPVVGVSIFFAITSLPAAFIPALNTRQTVWLNVAYVALAIPIAIVTALALLVYGTLFFMSVALWGCWSTVWMLRVQLALESAHADRAALALADERLRISRDLHDVFGRTLATIAVKSELAFELVRRGRDEPASAELVEIRRLAREAGNEVRLVVRGELQTTWLAELAGARSILAAAGIRCTVAGEEISTDSADTLAWVVREGVTNVLRHSAATQVTITTTVDGSEAQLTIANDGAGRVRPSVVDPNTGSGLAAMSGRVRAVGGRVETRRDGDWFLLDAIVPLTAGDRT